MSNDEYYLPYVLESIKGAFERAIIYNVGSEDNTAKIIDWWVDKEKDTECLVRHLPMVTPDVQICFRNSMIAEARTDCYWLLDGDEINDHPSRVPRMALRLQSRHTTQPRTRYGVVRRIEVAPDLKSRYEEERTHHRLYTRDAVWTGTHPGERAFYKQNWKSEIDFKNEVTVLHLHNALRSSKETVALGRRQRKQQRSYHPGKLIYFNLLEEYPILQE
ncbi:unnamed protein product, partial [marine sediment metagenome]